MLYREIAPTPMLAPYVRCVWTLDVETQTTFNPEPVFPDGSMELVFHLGEPFREVRAKDGERVQQPSFLVGQMHSALMLRPHPLSRVVGVRFLPGGAYPFLRFPQVEAAGRLVPLTELWNAAIGRLQEQLSASTLAAASVQVQRFLCDQLHPQAAGAFHRLDTTKISDRQHRRLFRQIVGLSPRDLAALRRFQRALRLIPQLDLPSAAAASGYYDQSHMALDFRRFAGITPSQWRGQQLALTASFVSESS